MKYDVIISWSKDDAAYIANVPDLPGCLAHGPTRSAALVNVESAADLWLKTANEFGDPIPEPEGRLALA